jgi:Na+-transporting NADH:ubiquinone oxidoreductase subunit B
MRLVRTLLDKVEPHFDRGGKLALLYPLYEAADTLFYTPGTVNRDTVHVRDGLDLKRMMITTVIALVPVVFMAMYNTGLQAHRAIAAGATPLDTWQTAFFQALGFGFSTDLVACFIHGALYFIPVFVVCFAVGIGVELVFAIIRGHEVNEGFFVTGFLVPLILPPTIPLWQVAVGTAFGLIVGKEVFGGTGMNFLNPALVIRAFLFFAYPAQISGDAPWIAADFLRVDGFTGATWLSRAVNQGPEALGAIGSDAWWQAFVGLIPGSMGETSALLCFVGAALLIATGIGSWRVMAGVVAGTAVMAWVLNAIGSATNPAFAIPFGWHIVLGGWAFGTVFMATDPVSAAFTNAGRWIYGIAIGVLVVLIRVVNPAYPEGMMLAILFMNMFAPFIDHRFVQANIKRRLARHAAVQ